jgi:Fe-S cluster biogenesis protein NfuA
MIDRDQVARAVAGLSAMFQGDGAALQLTALDEQLGTVELTLALHQVECADCVLPPDRLRDVIDGTLRRDVPGVRRLVLTDPREARPLARAPVQGPGAVITVLDPVGEIVPGNADPGPDAGLVAGRRIGFRVDVLWPAWDWTVAEWTERLERAGAAVTSWRRAQGLKGAEGERKQAEYDAFVGGVDVIVSGLGNCGSCTSWSVKDGLTGLARGLPSIVTVTEQFETLARTLAADQGRPGLRLLVLPFSLHTLPEDEVRRAARALFPGLLENLGARTG